MRASQATPFPGESIVASIGAVSAQVSGIARGVKYRVVSTQDCWFAYNQNAVVQEGMYLPAKVPDYFAFGMSDSEGTDLEVNVVSAFDGTIYFTPLKLVPTE